MSSIHEQLNAAGVPLERQRVVYKTKSPKPEPADSEYDQQAQAWLEKTDSTLTVEFARTGRYFDDDKEDRDIYNVTLTRGHASYTFTFGQSIAHSDKYVYRKNPKGPWVSTSDRDRALAFGEHIIPRPNPKRAQPSAYSILAALDGYSPGTFEEWCAEYGCDTDSRKAEKTWKACVEQYLKLDHMYSRENLDALNEID